jgi:hypothetical protein
VQAGESRTSRLTTPAQSGELLRVVGGLLDEQEELDRDAPLAATFKGSPFPAQVIRHVNVVRHGESISISWRRHESEVHRSLSLQQLGALALLGSQLRGSRSTAPSGWRELLRTVGQLIDAENGNLDGLFGWEGLFHVIGTRDGGRFDAQFTWAELGAVSELRRLLRNPVSV